MSNVAERATLARLTLPVRDDGEEWLLGTGRISLWSRFRRRWETRS